MRLLWICLIFSSLFPWLFGSLQCTEITFIIPGSALAFISYSQLYHIVLAQTWIFSQWCVYLCVDYEWVLMSCICKIWSACGLHGCLSWLGEQENVCAREGIFKSICDYSVCVFRAGDWVNYLKMLKKKQKQSKQCFFPFYSAAHKSKYRELHEIWPHWLQEVQLIIQNISVNQQLPTTRKNILDPCWNGWSEWGPP